jgi:hypothetical protein
MTDFPDKASILRALADGKTVALFGTQYRLTEGGIQTLSPSSGRWVPDSLALGANTSHYYLHVEPNPHPEGSYMWAHAEIQRGHKVKRANSDHGGTWNLFSHEDFIATDWCRA